jgi:hypothetical protein
VVRWKSTKVSEEYVASIFRVEEQEGSAEQVSSRAWIHAGFLLGVFYPESVPPKRGLTFNGLHGVMSQNMEHFIIKAVGT